MESRSRETTPTKEDLDFIADDGYKHDEDPDNIPKEKYVLTGPEFKRLTRNAKKLGAESLDYSTRKNNKYMHGHTSKWKKSSFWFSKISRLHYSQR